MLGGKIAAAGARLWKFGVHRVQRSRALLAGGLFFPAWLWFQSSHGKVLSQLIRAHARFG